MDRTEKREFVASLAGVFADTSMVVVTQNQGLTVAEATDLRRRMRAAGATFKVAKNRLALLALEGTRFDGIKPMLTGPTALAWSNDPVAVAKTAVEFAKTNEKLVLIGGALGAQTLDASEVRALAELPSLDQLRARLLGMIATPATRIAGVLQAPGRPARTGLRGLRQQGPGRGGGLNECRSTRASMACLRRAKARAVNSGLNGTNQRID